MESKNVTETPATEDVHVFPHVPHSIGFTYLM